MAQDRNLPEGTDKIIPGASETGEEVVVVEAVVATTSTTGSGTSGGSSGSATGGSSSGSQTTGSSTSGGTGSTGQSGGSTKEKLMESVRSGRDKVAGQTADKARSFVSQGLERSGDALTNVSRMVSDTAAGIDERLGPEYGNYARRAAEAIDSTAAKIRDKDPDELIDDTREFVRKSPGVALAGAAVIGFALARLVKVGLDTGLGRDRTGSDRDSDSGSTGSRSSTGTSGSIGSAGSTGSTGTARSTGSTGTSGSTGSTGTTGSSGATGSTTGSSGVS